MQTKNPKTPPEIAAYALDHQTELQGTLENGIVPDNLQTAYVSVLRRLADLRREERLSSEDPFYNNGWQPLPQQLERLHEDMRPLAEQARITTNVASFIDGYKQGKQQTGLRINQKDAFDNILTFLQQAPECVQEGLQTKAGYIDVPTAYGKTFIMTELVRAYSQRDPQTQAVTHTPKTLVLVPRKLLVRQTVGQNGKKGFGEFAPDINVTAYYSEQKDLSGDVVVMTYQSFNRLMQADRLDELGVSVILCDEAHHTLGNKTRNNLERFRQNKIAIGLTASSEYRGDKKVEQLLPRLIHQTELRTAIEADILSGVQCWSYKTDAEVLINETSGKGDFSAGELAPLVENGARNLHAVEFAKTFISHGLQGIISCIPGGHCAHAKKLAAELQKATIVDKETGEIRTIKAAAIGDFLSEDERDTLLDQYDAGELDVLTFVKMIGEGWDSENAKFLINLCPTSSPVRAIQRLGRILRPNGQLAQIVEFLDTFVGSRRKPPYTFMHALGERVFHQGLVIRSRNEISGPRQHIDALQLPTHIQQRLREIEAVPVEQLLVTPRQIEDAPEGWISIADLLQATPGLYSQSARRLLSENGFDSCIARSTVNTPTYFFPPASLEYLKTAELDLLPGGWNSAADLAKQHQITQSMTERILRDIKAIGRLGRRNLAGRKLLYYSPEFSESFGEVVSAVTVAMPTDYSLKRIAGDLGVSEASVRIFFKESGIVGALKRTVDRGPMAYFFTEDQALLAASNMRVAPMIQPGWASCRGLAIELGIDRDRVDRYIKKHFPKEVGRAVRIKNKGGKIVSGGIAFAPHVIEAARQALKPQNVPLGWRPLSTAISEIGVDRNSAKKIITALGITTQKYAPRGRKGIYISEEDIADIEAAWEARPEGGWQTAQQLAEAHGVSLHVAKVALDDTSLPGKGFFAPGFTSIYYSPEAIQKATRTIVASKVPVGWFLRADLARRFGVAPDTISNLLDDQDKAKTINGIAFAPDTIAVLEQTYGSIEQAPKGWHSIGEVATQTGVSYKTAQQKLVALTKSPETERNIARVGAKNQIATVFAPKLVAAALVALEKPTLPDGWVFLEDLAEELLVTTTTLGKILKKADYAALPVRGKNNNVASGYSGEAATYARAHFANIPIADDDWLTAGAIAEQAGTTSGAIRNFIKDKPGLKSKTMRHPVTRKVHEYFSPGQTTDIIAALTPSKIPEGHKQLTIVAADNNVGYAAILRLLRGEGFDLPEYRMPDGKTRIHLTPEGIDRIAKEYNIPDAQEGWYNFSEIGAQAGVPGSTVGYYAKKLGITPDNAMRMRSRQNRRPFAHYPPADVTALLQAIGKKPD